MCQALWYVAPVERVCTDPNLEYAVGNYADRSQGKLAVIVTKVDRDVTNALAKDVEKKGQSLGDIEQNKASIEHHNERLKGVGSKPKKKILHCILEKHIERPRRGSERYRREAEQKKFECVAHARNIRIVSRLKHGKAQYLPEGMSLPVYCVPNQHYAVHKEATPRESPLLEVKSTGIPDLRAFRNRRHKTRPRRARRSRKRSENSCLTWSASSLVSKRSS